MIRWTCVALALIGCGQKSGGGGGAPQAAASDAGAAAAPASDDPMVRWLRGQPGGNGDWLVAPLADLVRVAGLPAAAVARAKVSWEREQQVLVIGWELDAQPGRTPCKPLVDEVADRLARAGYRRMPAVGGEQVAAMLSTGDATRGLRFGCSDGGPDPRPGCTGDCFRQPSVHLAASLEIPAPRFRDVDGALVDFPPLARGIAATMLPRFLADRARTLALTRVSCERWDDGACGDDFGLWLEPPADARGWILETIDLAAQRGFQTSERYKDPEKDWIASTQDCSGHNLFYKVERGSIWVRVAAIIGAQATGNPVSCSDKVVPLPPTPAGTVKVMDLPLTARTVEHLDRLVACYLDHQARAGRTAAAGDWKRLGDYLERTVVDDASRLGATFGTEHHGYQTEPADGFYLRTRRPAGAAGTVELYAVQEKFTESFGRVVLTLEDGNGGARVTAQLGQADLGALTSRDALTAALLRAVAAAAGRSRAAAGKVQECQVLPNGGQDCEWRAASAAEQAAAEKRIEAEHAALAAAIRQQAGDLHAAVADMFPFERADCPLFRAGAPR